MENWVGQYIGIPFVDRGRDRSGCDCWGLVRLVLAEQFGVQLPSYADAYECATDGQRVSGLLLEGRALFLMVPAPQPGDVALLRVLGLPWHVGIVVADGWMLHTMRKIDAVLEQYDGLQWKNRVLGFYRPA